MFFRRSLIRGFCAGALLGASVLFAIPARADSPQDDRSFAGAVDTMIRLFTEPMPTVAPSSHRPPRAVEHVRPLVPVRPDVPARPAVHAPQILTHAPQAAPAPPVLGQIATSAHIVRVRHMPAAAVNNPIAVSPVSAHPAPLIAPLRAVSACHAAVMHCLNIDVR